MCNNENDAIAARQQYQSSVERSIEYIERFDILETINNVGNDEVFTPVRTCQKILDILPKEVWSNPNYKWLNPFDKNGVFLREIALKLDEGLKDVIPNEEARRKHILQDMLYSIGLTKFTSLVSRRTVYYCSAANRTDDGNKGSDNHSLNGHSIGDGTWFNSKEGNILSPVTEHEFIKGKCRFCGTSESGKYSDPSQNEHYAYEFIHIDRMLLERHLQNRFFKGDRTMKFDIIIGNPPYQLSYGIEGGNSSNSQSIYNKFISNAIFLNPKYLCMIVPSRWMTKTSQGIDDEWVDSMLQCKKFRVIHDYQNAEECFPNPSSSIPLKGGCNYFLWDRDYNGDCDYFYHSSDGSIYERKGPLDPLNTGILVRDPNTYSILNKISEVEGPCFGRESSKSFYNLVSPKHFFDDSVHLTSNWKDYKLEKDPTHCIKYYVSESSNKIPYGWISEDQIPKNKNVKDYNKVFIPAAGGEGKGGAVLGKPFFGEPNSVASQTYLVIGYNQDQHRFTQEECENIISYIKTKFFRFLVSIVKKTQNGSRNIFILVPIQDFSKPWTDEELYRKYGLSTQEISYIENYIEVMN